jgi:hypothetical protein
MGRNVDMDGGSVATLENWINGTWAAARFLPPLNCSLRRYRRQGIGAYNLPKATPLYVQPQLVTAS